MQFFIIIFASVIFFVLFLVTIVTVFFGAPIVFTDSKSLTKMIEIAGNVSGKKMVDLGSGDGRVVIEFAKRGIEAQGYEINPFLVAISKLKIKKAGLEKKAFIFWKNFWSANLSSYDIVSVFGINYIMPKLRDKLVHELKKNSIVISNSYKFPGWKKMRTKNGVYLYRMR